MRVMKVAMMVMVLGLVLVFAGSAIAGTAFINQTTINSVAVMPAWGGTGVGWALLGGTAWYEIESKEMLAVALTAYSTTGYVGVGIANDGAAQSMINNLWIVDAP